MMTKGLENVALTGNVQDKRKARTNLPNKLV